MTSYQGSMQAEDQIFFYWLMSKSCHNQKSTHWQQMHCNKHTILSLTCAYCCISVTCRDLSWKQNKCVKIRLACFLKVSSLPQPHPTPLKKCLWILDFFSSKTCLAHIYILVKVILALVKQLKQLQRKFESCWCLRKFSGFSLQVLLYLLHTSSILYLQYIHVIYIMYTHTCIYM